VLILLSCCFVVGIAWLALVGNPGGAKRFGSKASLSFARQSTESTQTGTQESLVGLFASKGRRQHTEDSSKPNIHIVTAYSVYTTPHTPHTPTLAPPPHPLMRDGRGGRVFSYAHFGQKSLHCRRRCTAQFVLSSKCVQDMCFCCLRIPCASFGTSRFVCAWLPLRTKHLQLLGRPPAILCETPGIVFL
jgi:hypothetical protein